MLKDIIDIIILPVKDYDNNLNSSCIMSLKKISIFIQMIYDLVLESCELFPVLVFL